MPNQLTETGTLYPPVVGLVYVFNLIVGTGALAMPKAFESAGWLISLILIIGLALMSYLTATFVVEAMASANALRRWRQLESFRESREVNFSSSYEYQSGPADERQPLLHNEGTSINPSTSEYYDITDRVEMGQMASMFFNKVGLNVFYLCIVVYLYGDLAIYAAAVPKSIRDVACTYRPMNNVTDGSSTCNVTLKDSDPCWPGIDHIDRIDAYRIFLAGFIVLMGPFLFFNAQKTKYLQLFTTLNRWIAFGMMISLAVIRISKGEGQGKPPMADFGGVPTLFGVCVYSFMCHHSLPSLVTPIRNKSKINVLLGADYVLILGFYSVLAFTGIFCFKEVQDLYTLNFQPNLCESNVEPITNIDFIKYFLALFPVFTLSSNFPIIGITLRNNLKTLVLKEGTEYHWAIEKLLFPLLTLIPPTIIALITNKIEMLVGITGSYAGAAIQYFVPAALVYYSRKQTKKSIGTIIDNKHTSPFKHTAWVIIVTVWATVAIGFVTVHHIIERK